MDYSRKANDVGSGKKLPEEAIRSFLVPVDRDLKPVVVRLAAAEADVAR
jgi:hypothetical protein